MVFLIFFASKAYKNWQDCQYNEEVKWSLTVLGLTCFGPSQMFLAIVLF